MKKLHYREDTAEPQKHCTKFNGLLDLSKNLEIAIFYQKNNA